jgi:alpha-1,3-mannosyl-glycoprotein beta-1,2-N-acetylglucosaminyltransferase
VPDLGPLNVPAADKLLAGYYRIARHYGYSLNYTLNALNYEAIIITEGLKIPEAIRSKLVPHPIVIDDLEVSPDFIDYFQALYPLLTVDETIWCISAWNDNGIETRIDRQASE